MIMQRLPLVPLLLIPLLTAYFVSGRGIVEVPWLKARYTMETLPESEMFAMTSEETGSTYRIFVQPPHGYHESEARYPVFYSVDGPPATPIYEEMILPLLRKGRISDTIFIGVVLPSPPRPAGNVFARMAQRWVPAGGPVATPRTRQLTFHEDEQYGEGGSGQGEAFLTFFRDEIVPEVDRRYRTQPGDRGLGGFDLGGLFAVEAGLRAPDVFSRIIAIAPRVQWADYALVDWVRARGGDPTPQWPRRIYLAVGDQDSDAFVNGWRTLTHALQSAAGSELTLHSELLRARNHGDVVIPAAQSGLTFVYEDSR